MESGKRPPSSPSHPLCRWKTEASQSSKRTGRWNSAQIRAGPRPPLQISLPWTGLLLTQSSEMDSKESSPSLTADAKCQVFVHVSGRGPIAFSGFFDGLYLHSPKCFQEKTAGTHGCVLQVSIPPPGGRSCFQSSQLWQVPSVSLTCFPVPGAGLLTHARSHLLSSHAVACSLNPGNSQWS